MRKYISSFFLWLLIVAIPVQGYAATGMMLCGLQHASEGMMMTMMHEQSSQQQLSQKNNASTASNLMPHDCEQHQQQQAAASPSTLHKTSSSDHGKLVSSAFKSGKCSACSQCCCHVATFLPSTTLQLDEASAESPPFVYMAAEHVTARSYRLERPPKRAHL